MAPVALAFALCLATANAVGADGVHLAIEPSSPFAAPGDTISVAMRIFQADEEFNGFDLRLGFDPAFLAYAPMTPIAGQRGQLMTDACPNLFHNFAARPDDLIVNLTLLCANTFVTGPGIIYQVNFVVVGAEGSTALSCLPGTRFSRAGFVVSPLECVPGEVVVAPTSVPVGPETEAAPAGAFRLSAWPNPYSGAGRATFAIAIPRRDTVRLDLFDASGRFVAGREPEVVAAGERRTLEWYPGAVTPGVYFVRATSGAGFSAGSTWTIIR